MSFRVFFRRVLPASFIGCVAVSACSNSNGSNGAPSGNTLYYQTIPSGGQAATYAYHITDNRQNLIVLTQTDDRAAQGSDGSFTDQQVVAGNNLAVNGTSYSPSTQLFNYDSTGQLISFSGVAVGNPESCSNDPAVAAVPFPIYAGQTWSANWTQTCGDQIYTMALTTGAAGDVESVTVTAGTYETIPVQYVIVRTNQASGVVVDSGAYSDWYSTTDGELIQREINHYYPPSLSSVPGYPVTEAWVLASSSAITILPGTANGQGPH